MSEKNQKTAPPFKSFCEMIGLKIIEMEKGFCRTELAVTDSHLNPYGSLHGGVVYTMADTGMGAALAACLEDEEICSTLEIKTSYLKSLRSGWLTCETRVIHKGKNIAFLDSQVKDQEGRLVATASGTFYIFKRSEKKG
jgi:acyl-CoA thioesterase